tara:strand:- start:18 stop:344 length:327 start_codon:yes stop_codon:yes gene_type:complete
MTSKQIVDNYVNTEVDVPESPYSAPVTTSVRIDAITAANNSSVNASYSLYIKTLTGALQPLIKNKIVVWGRSDLGIAAVNQVMPEGSELQFECSAINSIYFTVSGTEL